jgi:hypothetical protein
MIDAFLREDVMVAFFQLFERLVSLAWASRSLLI